jgi:hypothetical protein
VPTHSILSNDFGAIRLTKTQESKYTFDSCECNTFLTALGAL